MPSTVCTPCRLLLCCALAMLSAAALAKDGDVAAPPRSFTVIELPPTTPGWAGGRERTHHALSLATDAPKPFLRSLGLEPSECSLRFRLPTQIKPSRDVAGGVRVEMQAQAGMGCKF